MSAPSPQWHLLREPSAKLWIGVSTVAEAKREEKKVMPIDGNRDEQDNELQGVADESAQADPQAAGDSGLAAEVQKLKAEKEDLMQTMMRRQADFENFRKRTE